MPHIPIQNSMRLRIFIKYIYFKRTGFSYSKNSIIAFIRPNIFQFFERKFRYKLLLYRSKNDGLFIYAPQMCKLHIIRNYVLESLPFNNSFIVLINNFLAFHSNGFSLSKMSLELMQIKNNILINSINKFVFFFCSNLSSTDIPQKNFKAQIFDGC